MVLWTCLTVPALLLIIASFMINPLGMIPSLNCWSLPFLMMLHAVGLLALWLAAIVVPSAHISPARPPRSLPPALRCSREPRASSMRPTQPARAPLCLSR